MRFVLFCPSGIVPAQFEALSTGSVCKGTRFQEWMPVFFTVNILALLMPGYLQKSSITMTERG